MIFQKERGKKLKFYNSENLNVETKSQFWKNQVNSKYELADTRIESCDHHSFSYTAEPPRCKKGVPMQP